MNTDLAIIFRFGEIGVHDNDMNRVNRQDMLEFFQRLNEIGVVTVIAAGGSEVRTKSCPPYQ